MEAAFDHTIAVVADEVTREHRAAAARPRRRGLARTTASSRRTRRRNVRTSWCATTAPREELKDALSRVLAKIGT